MRMLAGMIVISSRRSVGRTGLRKTRNSGMRFAKDPQEKKFITRDIAAWEDEGGAIPPSLPPKCSQVQLKWRLEK